MRNTQETVEIRLTDGCVGAATHPDGDSMAKAKRVSAANVVTMLVRDEHCINVAGLQFRLRQAKLQLANAQSTINQKPSGLGSAGFNQRRVASAAAAQAFKPQCRPSAVAPKIFDPFKASAKRCRARSNLFEVLGDHVDNALGVGRGVDHALLIENRDGGGFTRTLDADAVFDGRD